MRWSHCGGALLARRPSRPRSFHPLSIESLESRTVLSAASFALEASLASVPADNVSLVADVATASAEEAPRAKAITTAATSMSAPNPVRLTGLRVELAESTLKPRPAATAELPTSRSTSIVTLAAAAMPESRFDDLSPTSKYCRKYSLSFCKVSLDDSVDPIYQCPGLDSVFCLPKRPFQGPTPESVIGSPYSFELTGSFGTERPLINTAAPTIGL
jgi:hypothetical protein